MANLVLSTETKSRQGYKRLAAHLQLPLTPTLACENEFENEISDHELDFPSSCSTSAGCWPADDHWEVESARTTSEDLKSVFEDWDEVDTGVEVTFDDDGAQVVHIPCDSDFYEPPTPPRHHQSFLGTRSNYPVTHFSDNQFSDSLTMEVRISTTRDEVPYHNPTASDSYPQRQTANGVLAKVDKGTVLMLDTSFITNMASSINLSALTASWRSPTNVHPDKSLPWKQEVKREADVPCSAIPFSPTDMFSEMHFNMIKAG